MTITPIAFTNSGVDIACDADLRAFHPDMQKNLWVGVESYREILNIAFDRVLIDLTMAGWNPALIPNTATNIAWMKPVVCIQALILTFTDFRAEINDRWDMLLADYHKKYSSWLSDPRLDYDTNDDGTIESPSEEEVTKGVVFVR